MVTTLLSAQRYSLVATMDGGSATGPLAATLLSLSPGGPATIVWLSLLQPASAAAAASVMRRVVRVIPRPPSQQQRQPSRACACIMSKRDIRFVEPMALS